MKTKHILTLIFFAIILIILLVAYKPFQEKGKRITLSKDGIDVQLNDIKNCNNPFEIYITELTEFRDTLNNKEYEQFINTNLVEGHSFNSRFKESPLFWKMVRYELIYVRNEDREQGYVTIDGTRKGVIFQSMLIFK